MSLRILVTDDSSPMRKIVSRTLDELSITDCFVRPFDENDLRANGEKFCSEA